MKFCVKQLAETTTHDGIFIILLKSVTLTCELFMKMSIDFIMY